MALRMVTEVEGNDFSPLKVAFMEMSGLVRPLHGMGCFSPEFTSWAMENADNFDYDCFPTLEWDMVAWPHHGIHCLVICRFDCHPNCRHATGCDKDPMVYCTVFFQTYLENGNC